MGPTETPQGPELHNLLHVDATKDSQENVPLFGDFVMWLAKADLTESSGLADYHSYGRWLVDNELRSAKLARWGNTASTLEGLDELEGIEQLRQLKRLFLSYLSVSAHSYL